MSTADVEFKLSHGLKKGQQNKEVKCLQNRTWSKFSLIQYQIYNPLNEQISKKGLILFHSSVYTSA